MKFVFYSKTNKDESTEICTPAMSRAKKGLTFKEDNRALPYASYYST